MTEPAAPSDLTASDLTGRWDLDATASEIRFTSKTMWGMVTVKGHFASFQGEGSVGQDGDITGSLRVEAASVDTGNTKRDNHLRSADFFDVANHPTITIKVTSGSLAEGRAQLSATIEVRGNQAPLELDTTVLDASAAQVSLLATSAVERTPLGITWNKLGVMRGPTSVEVKAVFNHQSD